MSTNAESTAPVVDGDRTSDHVASTDANQHASNERHSLTEALTLRRNLLQSLWIGIRQLPRGRRTVLLIRLCVVFAQIVAFIPILALPGSHRVSPSHERGRVCNPDSLFKYLVVHIVRLALDIPVELYLGLSPHRTRQGRRAGPEARAEAERDRPLGSEYLDVKVGKISTLLGIASVVIFFVGNAIVYSSTECSQKPAEAVPLFWSALASLIVVYIFVLEVAILAFLIVCALPLLIVIMRALGLNHRLPQRELHPETGKIDQEEVDKRIKLVYYTPAEEDNDFQEGQQGEQGEQVGAEASTDGVDRSSPASQLDYAIDEPKQTPAAEGTTSSRPGLGPRRPTQDSIQSASHPALGRFSRLTRILIARQRSVASASRLSGRKPSSSSPSTSNTGTPQTEAPGTPTAKRNRANGANRGQLKYPLHPLPAHRATCPICLCDFEEPEPEQEPEPEPLRLLDCGHVMHRSCVDQWLTTVSGRCPVCQKAVIPELETRPTEASAENPVAPREQDTTVQAANQTEAPATARQNAGADSVETDPTSTIHIPSTSATRLDEAQSTTARTRIGPTQAEPLESHELHPLDPLSSNTAS